MGCSWLCGNSRDHAGVLRKLGCAPDAAAVAKAERLVATAPTPELMDRLNRLVRNGRWLGCTMAGGRSGPLIVGLELHAQPDEAAPRHA
jgi:hypothetical protein